MLRGFKVLCHTCFASAWPLEMRKIGFFNVHNEPGLPSSCLAVDRAVDRAFAAKTRFQCILGRPFIINGYQMLHLVLLGSRRIP